MIVLVTESFNTAKGIIPEGKVIEIPDSMFNRLKGKVTAIPSEPETNTTTTAGIMDLIPTKDSINHRPYVLPYINKYGDVVIPFEADPKYFYWSGGQSLESTLTELGFNDKLRAKYSS